MFARRIGSLWSVRVSGRGFRRASGCYLRVTLNQCLNRRSKGMKTMRNIPWCFLRSRLPTLTSPSAFAAPNGVGLRRFIETPVGKQSVICSSNNVKCQAYRLYGEFGASISVAPIPARRTIRKVLRTGRGAKTRRSRLAEGRQTILTGIHYSGEGCNSESGQPKFKPGSILTVRGWIGELAIFWK
jgi:hypothetical protein